jgi:GT2 family glycosyltransferase
MLKVVTLVLNTNRREDTLACLASLRAMTYPTEIVVVDNVSTDGSADAVRASYPDVTVLETATRLGYTTGNNFGFDYIQKSMDVDAVFVLNEDTLAEPDMLDCLVAEFERMERQAVIGPEVRYADTPEIVWCAGGAIDWHRGYTVNMAIDTPTQGTDQQPFDVPFIVGCAMLIPIKALTQVGGFDPRYFIYWEEVDWCVRAHRAGYGMRIVPAAVLYHKVPRGAGGPTPRVLYYLTRNRLLFLRKHLPWYRQPLVLSWTLWGLVRTGIDLLQRRDWHRERALLCGICDAALGRTGISRTAW